MNLWPTHMPDTGGAAQADVRHDVEHVRLLRLMVTDTYRWKCMRAEWRVRFDFDPQHPGMTLPDITAFLHRNALSLCPGAEVDANVLYLRDEADLDPVHRAFGYVTHGLGHISAIQSRAAYDDAVRIAAWLADGGRPAIRAADPLDLPDLQWDVTGGDLHRVARTRVQGRDIVVRFGRLGHTEMWVVDVDGHTDCAHFRARADAMSKLGVAAALEVFNRK
jgi:hypothetical protein